MIKNSWKKLKNTMTTVQKVAVFLVTFIATVKINSMLNNASYQVNVVPTTIK